MARPKRHSHHLVSAKDEALLACDLYNQHRQVRNLEAFIVHMGIAWCNLLQAIFERDKVDYFYRKPGSRRYEYMDGERKSWDLARMLKERFPNGNDPVRKNVEFFIGLRNKVEHRLNRKARVALRTLVAGKAQSYVRNFERLLSTEFGSGESLAHELHLPLFLASLDDHAVQAVKDVRKVIPKGIASYIERFDANVGLEVAAHESYDFKLYLVPKTGSASGSDTALEFVNVSNLNDKQRQKMNEALVIIHDRQVEVANLHRMKPGAVVRRVKERCPQFTQNKHTWAWQFHKVRPHGSKEKTTQQRTDPRYCVYDEGHDDYVYTEAWVRLLIEEIGDDPSAAAAKWKSALEGASE